jgi:starch synthase
MPNMTILFAASEVAPLASTGGLGDVIASLPRFITKLGHDVVVALPGYPSLLKGAEPVGVRFSIPLGEEVHDVAIFERHGPDGTQWLLVQNDAFFGREGLYGDSEGAYPDNAARFILFSKAVVELACRLQPSPEVLHLHDWHTALVPMIIRDKQLPLKTVLTLHNVQHQGSFWAFDFALTNLSHGWFREDGLEFFGQMNLLKGGMLSADALTTPSNTYRQNILTTNEGYGLQAVLQSRQHDLFSIPNGVDPDRWNPADPTDIPAPFSATDLDGKLFCRNALLAEAGLAPQPTGPVYAMLGRLADQKGFDLLLPLLPRLLAADARLIIIGDGEPSFRRDLFAAVRQHPTKMAFCNRWEPEFSKDLLAGADILLSPSHYEPCGLTPLHALRYGTIPLAHATGGLVEQLTDYDPSTRQGNSLLYFPDSSSALWDTIERARGLFADKNHWHSLVTNALHTSFPWENAAAYYHALYQRMTADA